MILLEFPYLSVNNLFSEISQGIFSLSFPGYMNIHTTSFLKTIPSCTQSFLLFNFSVSHTLLVSFALNQELILCGLRREAHKWALTNQVGWTTRCHTPNPTDTALSFLLFNFSVSHTLFVCFALNQELILCGWRRQAHRWALTNQVGWTHAVSYTQPNRHCTSNMI